jgi:hypothetical protein
MKDLDLFLKVALSIAATLLVAFMCYILSQEGKIAAEFGVIAVVLTQVSLTSGNLMWFNDNSKLDGFVYASKTLFTIMLIFLVVVLYFCRQTSGAIFLACTAFMPLVMTAVHWVSWYKRNVSVRVSLKG